MNTFRERMLLTDKIESKINNLFDCNKVSIQKFGCESIIQNNKDLISYIKQPEANTQASAMVVKYAPDFILLKKDESKQLFFLDVKHSITPIWADSRINKIRDKNQDKSLNRSRIGVVAREALLSYRRYYPNTIVMMASPYNSKLLMAQFAEKVRCLYCYRDSNKEEYDCNNCPSKKGGFFDVERATKAKGSQTPMTNIDLGSFESVDVFCEKYGLEINKNILDEIKQMIKQEQIEFDNNVNENIRNKIRHELSENGCIWIDYRVYSKEGNSFIHLNGECPILNKSNKRLETYYSILHASKNGKTTKCKYCYILH